MKRKRLWEEQIAFVLRQADSGTTIAGICARENLGANFYHLKKVYAGIGVAEIREREVEACGDGRDPRSGDVARCLAKKWRGPPSGARSCNISSKFTISTNDGPAGDRLPSLFARLQVALRSAS